MRARIMRNTIPPRRGHIGRHRCARGRAFTLVEVVMVVAIIGLLAMIATPRFARSADAAGEAALAVDTRIVREAILLYAAEHNGCWPGPAESDLRAQLLTYSDVSGATDTERSNQVRFGPYLAEIPPLPIGRNAGRNSVLIDTTTSPPTPQPAAPYGWVYSPVTGEFLPNLPMDELLSGGFASHDPEEVGGATIGGEVGGL